MGLLLWTLTTLVLIVIKFDVNAETNPCLQHDKVDVTLDDLIGIWIIGGFTTSEEPQARCFREECTKNSSYPDGLIIYSRSVAIGNDTENQVYESVIRPSSKNLPGVFEFQILSPGFSNVSYYLVVLKYDPGKSVTSVRCPVDQDENPYEILTIVTKDQKARKKYLKKLYRHAVEKGAESENFKYVDQDDCPEMKPIGN